MLDPITALLFHLSGLSGLGRTRTSYLLPFGKPRYQTCDHQPAISISDIQLRDKLDSLTLVLVHYLSVYLSCLYVGVAHQLAYCV